MAPGRGGRDRAPPTGNLPRTYRQRTEPARRHPPITAPKNTPETRQEHPATNPSTDDDPIDRVLALSAGGVQRWCPTGDSPLAVGTGLTVVVTRQGLAETLSQVEPPEKARLGVARGGPVRPPSCCYGRHKASLIPPAVARRSRSRRRRSLRWG